jgi:hypothetical protein
MAIEVSAACLFHGGAAAGAVRFEFSAGATAPAENSLSNHNVFFNRGRGG